MLNDHRGVMFDLDGTLLDTIEDIADSTNAVLEQMGFPSFDVQDYNEIVGDGIHNQAWRVLPEGHRDDATVDRVVDALRREYARRWADKTRPYDGIPELLSALQGRGFTLCVLSNKDEGFTRRSLERFLADHDFAVVHGARAGVPLKPDPTAALETAEEAGLPPEKFYYLGDTNTDMRTADAAGMYAVGVLWGFRGAQELKENGADALIEKPVELLELL
jgi:phosphoglycolate phosphatase